MGTSDFPYAIDWDRTKTMALPQGWLTSSCGGGLGQDVTLEGLGIRPVPESPDSSENSGFCEPVEIETSVLPGNSFS